MKNLTGMRFGLIGTKEIQEKFKVQFMKLGVDEVDIINLCAMNLMETNQIQILKMELSNLDQYQWVVFTSQNAIKLFFDTMEHQTIDRSAVDHIKFAVVGNGTKQSLLEYGYQADFVPTTYTSKDLAIQLSQIITPKDRLLIPRARQGSEVLGVIFKENSIDFLEIPIYDVVGTLTDQIEHLNNIDCLVFASASGVNSFIQGLEQNKLTLPKKVKIACIGNVTAKELKHYNITADIISKVNDVDGLISSIVTKEG